MDMQWWEYILLALAISCVLVVVYIVMSKVKYRNIIENTSKLISNVFSNAKIETFRAEDITQITFNHHKDYSIKLIHMNSRHEVIITNSDRVIVNENIKDWKRSTKPNFVKGMREYFKSNSNDNHIKIVLIYPDCHNITKYLNESDVILVERFQKIDNVYFIKYSDLEEFLRNQ